MFINSFKYDVSKPNSLNCFYRLKMMPQNYGRPANCKPCSPVPSSHYDYYQHDQDESLDKMTMPITAAELPLSSSMRCVSTSTCSIDSAPMTVASSPSVSTLYPTYSGIGSRGASRDSQFPHRMMGDDGGSSRIPRRVKSSPTAGNGNAGLVGGGGGSRGKQRSTFTSCGVPTTTSVVSSCLLSNYGMGGGDGVSLDPEVDLWLDIIPLSRKPFKNFHRDFADGVLMAEIMAYFFPKKVDLHNYVPASASSAKKANYDTLNQKVFAKMGVKLADNLIDGIIQAKPGYIEKALQQVHRLIDNVDRKHVETRAKELSCLAGSFDGSSPSPSSLQAPFVEELCLVRNVLGEIPDCVIYQNIKYYPSTTLEVNSKTEEQLREKNNELCNKVRRLETLLGLKESHLQDLTSKILELRAKYESSQQELPDN